MPEKDDADMKNRMGLFLSAFAAGSLIGCAPFTILSTREIRAVQAHVDSLGARLTVMQEKLLKEELTQEEMLRLIRAYEEVHFNEIDLKESRIRGDIVEDQDRLSKIDDQTIEYQKLLEAKLAADSSALNSRAAEIDKLLQIAMNDFNAGRFDIAFNGFKELYGQFPGSPQAQDAEYWAAECLYAKKEYDEAIKAYIEYLRKYPSGAKVENSLYKLGLAYEKESKSKEKEMVWKKLLEQFPDSQEAKLVKINGR